MYIEFWAWERTNFLYKLMVSASLLYAILSYKRFCRDAVLSDSRGNLYLIKKPVFYILLLPLS